MKKNKIEVPEVLNYRKACNDIAKRISEKYFNGATDWFWVADDIGSLACFNDFDFLTPEDMALLLEHDVSYSQYALWRDENIEHFALGTINLKSWLKGARHTLLQPQSQQ